MNSNQVEFGFVEGMPLPWRYDGKTRNVLAGLRIGPEIVIGGAK